MKLPANWIKLPRVEQGIWKVKDKQTGTEKFFVYVSVRHPDDPRKRPSRQSIVNNVTEARLRRKEFIRELEDYLEKGPSKTFAEFIPEYYRYIEGCKKASSVIREKSSIEAHFLPELGSRSLKDISVKDCEVLLGNISEGKSTQTKLHLHSHLSNIFKRARKRQYVLENPCDLIDRPSKRRDKNENPSPAHSLSEEQIKLLLDHLQENHPLMFYHVALAYFTGCRAGELRALLWSDVSIDSDKKSIRISKSLDAKSSSVGTTKTDAVRTVPVNAPLLRVLQELKQQTCTSPSQPVLPHWREFHAGEQAKSLKIVCKCLGLPPIKFHDLRACLACPPKFDPA